MPKRILRNGGKLGNERPEGPGNRTPAGKKNKNAVGGVSEKAPPKPKNYWGKDFPPGL